jgi:dsDNA-specific endonuclease/ATPase MutS2
MKMIFENKERVKVNITKWRYDNYDKINNYKVKWCADKNKEMKMNIQSEILNPSPIQENNFKVGDKFKIIQDGYTGNVGDILELITDNGTTIPLFKNLSDETSKFKNKDKDTFFTLINVRISRLQYLGNDETQ